MYKNKCFSLIELLVVLAIIGILSSLLLPSLGQARESAKQTSCMNNMKQMYLGITGYVDDNNGYYPATSFKNEGVFSRSLHDGIATYVMTVTETGHNAALYQSYDEGGVFTCPSFDQGDLALRGVGAGANPAGFAGYGTNPALLYNMQTGVNGMPRRFSDLLFDSIAHAEEKAEGVFSLNFYLSEYGVYLWHKSKKASNYLYTGGHVTSSQIHHLMNFTARPWDYTEYN